MNEQNTTNKIIIFSCLIFVLMAVHIVGIIETHESQVKAETTTMSAFNG